MISLVDLWLPVLMAAIFVFIASSVIHMVLPIHKSDYNKLSDEPGLLDAIRPYQLAPGDYMFPCPASMKDMGSPEMIAKYEQGPVGLLTMLPNSPPPIGKSLWQWFVYSLVLGAFVAYAATLSLKAGDEFGVVFKLTATVAIAAYGFSSVPNSIWKYQSWCTTAKFVFDGVVYGLVTAAAFGWFWPAAS